MFFPIFSIIIGAGFGVLVMSRKTNHWGRSGLLVILGVPVLLGFMLGWYVDTHYLAYSAIIDWEWAGNPFQKAAALIDLAAWGIAGLALVTGAIKAGNIPG